MPGVADEVAHEEADEVTDEVVAGESVEVAAVPVRLFDEALPDCQVFELVGVEQAGAESVVEVVGVVGEFVGGVRDLRFQAAACVGVKVGDCAEIEVGFVLGDGF